jgi:DNA-binding MarR family transcriptional regulator
VGDQDLVRQARDLVPRLYGLARALRMSGAAEAGLDQLPPSDLEVLRYVLDSPGVSPGAVSRDLGLQTSNVSTTVRGLVARGLITREPDPSDRRSVRLQPTIAALRGMAGIEDAWAALFAQALGDLDDKQRTALVAAGPALQVLAGSLRARWKP